MELVPFSELLLNRSKLEKTFNMKKQRIFISFPTPYHLPQLDQPFRDAIENTNSVELVPFSKLLLNRSRLEKTSYMKKQRIFISFPTPYHLTQLDQPFRNDIENTNSAVRFAKFYDFPNYSLSIGNQRKVSTCGRSDFAGVFQ